MFAFNCKPQPATRCRKLAIEPAMDALEKREVYAVSVTFQNGVLSAKITGTDPAQRFEINSPYGSTTPIRFYDGVNLRDVKNTYNGKPVYPGEVKEIRVVGSDAPNVIRLSSVEGARGYNSNNLDRPGGVFKISVDAKGSGDTIYGSAFGDEIWGGSGNDKIISYAGNDRIWDGNGKDSVYAGLGNDDVYANNPLSGSFFDGYNRVGETNNYYGPRPLGVSIRNFKNTTAPLSIGMTREQLLTNPAVFDPELYLLIYPDLEAAFGRGNYDAARSHWLNYGIREGRRASITYDPNWYLASNPDLQLQINPGDYEALMTHFLDHGIEEGREASREFNVSFYMMNHTDLQQAFGPVNMRAGLSHFISNGMYEGRNTSSEFSIAAYLNRYTDLQQVIGPNYRALWIHWLRHGLPEGRDPRP